MSRGAPPSSLPPARPPLSRLVVSAVSGAITLVLVAFLLTIGSLWMFNGAGPVARSGATSTTVLLRPGAGLTEIAGALQKAGVVRSASVFAAGAQMTGAAKQLKAGEYEFLSHASMSAILKDIRAGKVVRHAVTVPEGLTAEMVVDLLQANDILTGAAPVPPEEDPAARHTADAVKRTSIGVLLEGGRACPSSQNKCGSRIHRIAMTATRAGFARSRRCRSRTATGSTPSAWLCRAERRST